MFFKKVVKNMKKKTFRDTEVKFQAKFVGYESLDSTLLIKVINFYPNESAETRKRITLIRPKKYK